MRAFSAATVLAECGLTKTFGRSQSGLSGGSGSCSKTSSAAPRSASRPQRLDQRGFVDDVAARDVDEDRAGLQQERAGVHRAAGASARCAAPRARAHRSPAAARRAGRSARAARRRALRACGRASSRTVPTTRASSARASRATSRPILPRPTTHTVLPAHLLAGEALPVMLALFALEPQHVLAEHQHREHDELGKRPRVHAARRRDRDRALGQPDTLGELADARRSSPGSSAGCGRARERRRKLERPEIEEHLGLVEERVPALSRAGIVERRQRMVRGVARGGASSSGSCRTSRRASVARIRATSSSESGLVITRRTPLTRASTRSRRQREAAGERAAVDVQHGAGDVARGLGAEEEHRLRDVGRMPGTAERDRAHEPGPQLLGGAVGEGIAPAANVDVAGRDDIRPGSRAARAPSRAPSSTSRARPSTPSRPAVAPWASHGACRDVDDRGVLLHRARRSAARTPGTRRTGPSR